MNSIFIHVLVKLKSLEFLSLSRIATVDLKLEVLGVTIQFLESLKLQALRSEWRFARQKARLSSLLKSAAADPYRSDAELGDSTGQKLPLLLSSVFLLLLLLLASYYHFQVLGNGSSLERRRKLKRIFTLSALISFHLGPQFSLQALVFCG